MSIIRTAEWVSQGHPDKVADSISDAILSAYLKEDPDSHCGIETAVCKDRVFVMGEVSSKAEVDVEQIVRDTIKNIGYTYEGFGFNYETVSVTNCIVSQSSDIAMGVNKEATGEVGAGDQGFSVGYAVAEGNDNLMPTPVNFARELGLFITENVKDKPTLYYPDLKTQVSLRYNPKTGEVESVDTVVVSQSHSETLDIHSVRRYIKSLVHKFINKSGIEALSNLRIYVNPTGRFVLHGPASDSGLTGRKLAVDNYGDAAVIGGGAFSGKDLTKVDRSGAYFARLIAKTVVAAGLAKECSVQLSWAIGMRYPVSINVRCREATMPSSLITKGIREVFSPSVSNCIKASYIPSFDYSLLSKYGHFGNTEVNGVSIPWENTEPWEKSLKKWMKDNYIPRDKFED